MKILMTKKGRNDEIVKYARKTSAQITFLIAAIVMLCFGIWRDEAAMVLSKAIRLCLECVGIG